MAERFVSAVPTQSEAYREAVRRAEEKAAGPPPTKTDTRANLFFPNGWAMPNPDFMREVPA